MRFSVRAVAAIAAASSLAAGAAAMAAGPPGSSSRVASGSAGAADPARVNLPAVGDARPVARATTSARQSLRGSLGRQAVLTVDERTGGVKAAGRLDGYLTGRSSDDAKTVTLRYLRAHSDAFGLDASDLAGLKLVRDYTSRDGVTHLQWAQVVDGFTVADSSLLANVTREGRLVNVLGGLRGGLKLNTARPAVAADKAYARTLRSVGSSAQVPAQRSARSGGTRATVYAGQGRAELVAVSAGDGLRLAWRVLAPVGRDGDYDSLVDASTGRLLRRANLVKFANALAAENYPGAPVGGEQESRDITPWLFAGENRLNGNNTHTFLDVDDVVGYTADPDAIHDHNDIPPSGEVPPSDGTNWNYAIQSVPDASGDCPADPPGCTWNHNLADSWQVNKNEAATQLFYFVNRFHDHLMTDAIGFDEASGNFQQNNTTGQGLGGDPVLAQADDGANTDAGLPDGNHIDNANMDTRPDGGLGSGRMQMYLFKAPDVPGEPVDPFAAVNGADDPSIVYHEYTHGLSNRLITDAQGYGAITGIQSGAMGEAWSDWYALDFLADQGLIDDTDDPGEISEGAYVDGGQNLIRSEPIDCPADQGSAPCPGFIETGPGGYTYQDFGLIAIGALGGSKLPEPHGDGEIWAQTLWQLRQGLVKKYGPQAGSAVAEKLITGGMRLSPPNPSFLDERNAILQESTILGGQDTNLIWQTFADRGMGYFASTTGDQDGSPEADFSMPPAPGSPTGTLKGVITDDQSQPVAGAVVGLGGHDGPPATGPALQAVSAADGTYTLSGIPQGHYPHVTVDGPGTLADTVAGSVTIDGAAATKDVQLRRNFANALGGAKITTDARDESNVGCGVDKMIDGNQATSIDTNAPVLDDPSTDEDETEYRTFTIKLPAAVNGAEVWIDPGSQCYELQFSSLASYAVQLSTDGSTFGQPMFGSFDRSSNGRLNRVPLRNVPEGVVAVRLTALTTQGDSVGALIDDGGFLDIADVQVYGRPGGTPPAPGGGGGGGGTTPTPAATLRPSLASTKHKLTVNRKTRRLNVKLRCVQATAGTVPTTCRGRITLPGGKKGRKAFSTRTFAIAAQKTATVRLKLTRKAIRILRKGRVETKLRATVVNPGAGSRKASWPVRVQLSKAKKKKKKK
jgi:extracellular elastinolytic metalloproteinase